MMPVSRRDVARLTLLGPIFAMCPAIFATCSRPVVGFLHDAPWLDLSGRDMPYRPPSGSRPPAPDSESLMRLGHFL